MYGICHLSNIPVRKEKTSKSELVTQLIYGELYKIVEKNKKWYLIEIYNDKYKGWINYSQFKEITKKEFNNLRINDQKFLKIIYTELETKSGTMLIGIGAVISNCNFLNHKLKNNLNQLFIDNKTQIYNKMIEEVLMEEMKQKFDIFFFDPPFADFDFYKNLNTIKKKKICKK